MKKTAVIVVSALALAFSAYAEAAKPRKRTRNSNRIGAYGVGVIGLTKFTSDVSEEENGLLESLTQQGVPTRNLETFSDLEDLGYQASFGFRFNRFMAAELSLIHIGETTSTARGELDFGDGFVPVNLTLGFSAGGPLMSVIGILPLNDRFELFGRAGYLFTSSRREIRTRVDGENYGGGAAKGDSQDLIYGAGAAWHFNQVYSLRLEYLQMDELGESQRSGTEDANVIGLGLVVRF
jgi:opacity protein-like surface antigen